MQSLAYRFVSARKNLGLSRIQVSESICSPQLYGMYERGEILPPSYRIPVLCQRLRLNLEEVGHAFEVHRSTRQLVRNAIQTGRRSVARDLLLELARDEPLESLKVRYLRQARITCPVLQKQ